MQTIHQRLGFTRDRAYLRTLSAAEGGAAARRRAPVAVPPETPDDARPRRAWLSILIGFTLMELGVLFALDA